MTTNPVEQDGVVVPFVLVMRSGVSSTNDMEYGRFKEYELAMAVGRLLLEADALCHPEWCGFEVISPEQAAAPAPEAQAPAAGVLCSACDGEGHTPDSNACDYCDATGVFARTPQPEALGELPEPAVHWTEPLPLRDGGAVAAATYYTTDQMRERDRKWIAAIALASRPRVDEAMVERAQGVLPSAIDEPLAWPDGFADGWNDCIRTVIEELPSALRAALGEQHG